MTIKSVYDNQRDILDGIKALYCPDGFDADVTYGNGSFYGDATPRLKFDIDPQLPCVIQADSRRLPLGDESVSSVVFDPPFLTYVGSGRTGNGDMALARRFSGYWRYDELEEHYTSTFREVRRILKSKGVMVLKCQDIIHNHSMHPTHISAVEWADGFKLEDLFILSAKSRMPSPNRNGTQKHARIYHSYFMVFRKVA